MIRASKISSRALLLFLAVVAVIPAIAQDAAKQISEFDVNGLKVIVKRRAGTPTVAAGLFFRGGSRNLTSDTAGIESFVLRVATEGSKSFPRAILRKESARIGTTIGAGANYDYSVVSLACTKQNFDASWRMFTDIVLNPAFAAADIELVRETTINGLRTRNDAPESQLEELSSRIVYAGHPYSRDPYGTIENLRRFKDAELAAYHRSMLQTSRMLLVIVGDIEPEALRAQIAKSFEKVPRGNYKDAPLPPLAFSKPTVDVESKPTQTDYVTGTFSAPSIGDPDYYAMRTAISALATNVFQEVRVKRSLSYAPSADMNSMAANTATISVSSSNPNEAIRIMLGEMKNLRETQLSDATLKELSGFFLTTHYIKQETNTAQAAELAQYELLGGGWRNSLQFLEKIRKVTAAEVQAAAKKYMVNVRFTVVGNPDNVNRSVFLQN